MLEKDFTKKHVTPAIRMTAGGAPVIAIKHCDLFTKGIPDLTASFWGQTFWIESKVLRGTKDLAEEIAARKQQLQHLTLIDLARVTHDRACYVVRDERTKTVYWCNPLNLDIKMDVRVYKQIQQTLEGFFLTFKP